MPTAWCFFIADTVTNRKVSLRSSSSSDSTALSRISDPLTGQIPPTVWTYFAELQASQPSPSTLINLGQGYPDSSPPQFALESLASAVSDATTSHLHQYTRSSGHPFLVKTLASRYSTHFNRFVDPMKEVVVTVGASQALFVSLQSLVKEGDEVVVFSPYFDLYINQIKLAGGVPVLCDLCYDKEEKIWDFDKSNFERCLTPKTSVVVLNSPHNPTGKTFSRVEMEVIASSIEAHKDSHIRVLSDEVYKFIIHKGEQVSEGGASYVVNDITIYGTARHSVNIFPTTSLMQHTHFATIPSMSERTITISSAGKTFSATGWQVGWAVGEPHLIQGMQSLMPYVQFCASTVVQEGVGRSIIRAGEREGEYYESLRNDYKRKRDVIIAGLRAANENYASGSDDIFRLPSFDDR